MADRDSTTFPTMRPLERHRKSLGLSREDVAKRVGVTMQSVWAWERGKSEPAADKYPLLAKALRLTPIEVTELIAPSEVTAA